MQRMAECEVADCGRFPVKYLKVEAGDNPPITLCPAKFLYRVLGIVIVSPLLNVV